jgi:hypothetical protein
MTATAAAAPVHLERAVAGIGTIYYDETVDRMGRTRRKYSLLPEGGQRRQTLTSVTTILRGTWPKPGLLEWYAREGAGVDTALEAASARGRAVHKFVEVFMETGDILPFDAFPADYAPYLQGIARFLWEHDPKPIAVERLVAYPEFGYAGRLDLIAAMDEAPTLLDFKSNPKGRIYPEAHVQAHAYRIAEKKCRGADIDRVALVGVAEDGTYNVVEGADASKMWGAVLDFWKTLQRFDRELEKVA